MFNSLQAYLDLLVILTCLLSTQKVKFSTQLSHTLIKQNDVRINYNLISYNLLVKKLMEKIKKKIFISENSNQLTASRKVGGKKN